MIKFDNVTYAYSFTQKPAVKNINLEVKAGELVLCTGASGCGKTTLMRLANGLCPHQYKGDLQGDIFIDDSNTKDTNINTLSSTIGTLLQDPEQQFFALAVEDELAFSHECRGLAPDIIRERIEKALELFSIEHIRKSSIHELSEGQKQKVGLSSLYSQNLKALILDEPSANLDPESSLDLALKLKELKEQGMAIFVVDHRLYWLEGIADKVIVMSEGEIKEEGDFSLLHDAELRKKYGLRSSHVEDTRYSLPAPKKEESQENGLYVENISFAYKGKAALFENASFSFVSGISALIGDNGKGKTSLARILTGLNKVSQGEFFLNGEAIEQSELIKHIGIVLQNADHQLHMRTVLEEVEMCFALAYKQRNAGKKNLKSKEIKSLFEEKSMQLLRELALENLSQRHPQSLSGGEKQRLIIACAMAKEPAILILDEPTSGLDGANMLRIKNVLKNLASSGTSVLVITHDLELIEQACSYSIVLK